SARCAPRRLVRTRSRRVIVNEETGKSSPRNRLDVLRHRLQMDLDQFGLPFLDQAVELLSVFVTATLDRPRRHTGGKSSGPCQAPCKRRPRRKRDLLHEVAP